MLKEKTNFSKEKAFFTEEKCFFCYSKTQFSVNEKKSWKSQFLLKESQSPKKSQFCKRKKPGIGVSQKNSRKNQISNFFDRKTGGKFGRKNLPNIF